MISINFFSKVYENNSFFCSKKMVYIFYKGVLLPASL
jgi:hypothetical protein